MPLALGASKVWVGCKVPSRQVAVVTQGGEGCWYRVPGWPAPKHQPAFAVKVVDTTGAGDCFNAGFLYGYVKGLPLDACLRYGNICGGLSTTRRGCQAAPTAREIEQKAWKLLKP